MTNTKPKAKLKSTLLNWTNLSEPFLARLSLVLLLNTFYLSDVPYLSDYFHYSQGVPLSVSGERGNLEHIWCKKYIHFLFERLRIFIEVRFGDIYDDGGSNEGDEDEGETTCYYSKHSMLKIMNRYYVYIHLEESISSFEGRHASRQETLSGWGKCAYHSHDTGWIASYP